MRRKPPSDNWHAWALLAIAALLLTNAGWFFRWKVREASHVEALNAVIAAQPRHEPRVVYEYRQATTPPPPASSYRRETPPLRDLEHDEACFGGTIIRRSGAGIESTGERCRQ